MNNMGDMRGRNEPNAGFVRPDMFHPSSLTDEESRLLAQLRYESTWKRGYPYAFVAGAVTAVLTKRFTTPVRIMFTGVSAVTGNVVGRISYLPTIQKRLLSDLSPESPLRQKLELYNEKGPSAFMEEMKNQRNAQNCFTKKDEELEPDSFFDDRNEDHTQNMRVEEKKEDAPKKLISYEELRKRNRDEQTNRGLSNYNRFPASPPQSAEPVLQSHDELPNDASEQPKKVRYNKYGDAIIE